MKQHPKDDAINQGDAAAANEGAPGNNLHRNDSGFSTGLPPFRKNGPKTSRDAAISIAPVAPTRRMMVLATIADAGEVGLTDDEGESKLAWRSQSWTPRRRELAIAGHVEPNGHQRQTLSGRMADVYVVTKGGLALLQTGGVS